MFSFDTDQRIVLKLYQTVKDVDYILRYSNINYFIHAGTLLGAVRHKGLIPHDDDIDIVILKQDEQAFLRLEQIFNDSGYDIKPIFFGYKIISKDPIEYLAKGKVLKCYPWIDVMIFVERNGIYEYENKDAPWYHNAKLEAKDLYPLKNYEFGECKLLGPNNPYPYLSKVYKKWRIKAYIWNHFYNVRTSKYLDKRSVQPHAKPTGPLADLPSHIFFKLKNLIRKS